MFPALVSSPRVRLSSLTNTQGKPQYRLLYWSRKVPMQLLPPWEKPISATSVST